MNADDGQTYVPHAADGVSPPPPPPPVWSTEAYWHELEQALEADATRRVVEKWRKEGFSQQRIREGLERLERCKTETVIRERHRYVDPASGRPYWHDATTGRSYWDDATASAPLNDPAAAAPAPAAAQVPAAAVLAAINPDKYDIRL